MKVKVTFLKVHCVDDTNWEWREDEIYFVVVPVLFKDEKDESPKPGRPKLSKIEELVKKNTIYKPVFTDNKDYISIDTGESSKLELNILLFEADRRGFYNGLLNNPAFKDSDIPDPEWLETFKKQYEEVKKTVKDGKLDWKKILKIAYKVSVALLKQWAKDDLIERKPAIIDLDSETSLGYRELTFSGIGATYIIGFNVERTE